jgi:PAS domain S-box-containing protein
MDVSRQSEQPPLPIPVLSLLKRLPLLLWTTDRDLRVTLAEGGLLASAEGQAVPAVGGALASLFANSEPAGMAVDASHRALAGERVSYAGSWRDRAVEVWVEPVHDAAGSITGTVGVALDVTAYRRAEQALVHRTERLLAHQKVLVELARMDEPEFPRAMRRILETDAETLGVERVGLWLFNADCSELTCQGTYLRSTRRIESGITLRWRDYPAYFRAISEARVLAAEDAIEDPRTREFTESYLRPLGITSMMDVPIWSGGRIVGIVCHEHVGPPRRWSVEDQEFGGSIADLVSVALEYSQRHEAQQALRANEARMEQILRQVPGVLWTTDRELRLTSVQGRSLDALGLQDARLVGRSVFDWVPGGAGALDARPYHDAVAGKASELEVVFDGRTFQLRVEPLFDPAGAITGIIGIAYDITERKEAEARVQHFARELEARVAERTAELAAANRELEAFTYSVSHDLRAPLRALDGFSDALLEGYAERLDATGRDYVLRIRAASQRMTQLIDALLALSRVGRAEIQRRPVDLSALARAIADELQRAQPERAAEFVIAEGLQAEGDPRLLRVLLENLLGNAWKFTRDVPRARIEFGAAERDGRRAFSVRDNGAGFDMARADRLFQPFQRLHAAAEFEGTGIGLATVQRIVQRHGGEVWAEGRGGEGAVVWFTL